MGINHLVIYVEEHNTVYLYMLNMLQIFNSTIGVVQVKKEVPGDADW